MGRNRAGGAVEEEDDRGFFDRAGDFFGGLARDVQDFSEGARIRRVDSHGSTAPLRLICRISNGNADGISSAPTDEFDPTPAIQTGKPRAALLRHECKSDNLFRKTSPSNSVSRRLASRDAPGPPYVPPMAAAQNTGGFLRHHRKTSPTSIRRSWHGGRSKRRWMSAMDRPLPMCRQCWPAAIWRSDRPTSLHQSP